MRPTRPGKNRHGGFTLVELALVIVILGFVLPSLGAILIGAYRDGFFQNDKVTASNQISTALWFMDEKARFATSFLAVVPGPFSDPYGPHNLGADGTEAWSYKGDSAMNRVLIIASQATSGNALNTGRQPVFIQTPEFSCNTQMYYQPKLTFVTIFFVRSSTLYRRVLTDTTTTLCPGNAQFQKQSCPPEIPVGSRNAICKANDEALATDVNNFTVKYYQLTSAGVGTQIDPAYTSSDPDVLAEVDYVEITLTESMKNGTASASMTQRITKVNNGQSS